MRTLIVVILLASAPLSSASAKEFGPADIPKIAYLADEKHGDFRSLGEGVPAFAGTGSLADTMTGSGEDRLLVEFKPYGRVACFAPAGSLKIGDRVIISGTIATGYTANSNAQFIELDRAFKPSAKFPEPADELVLSKGACHVARSTN